MVFVFKLYDLKASTPISRTYLCLVRRCKQSPNLSNDFTLSKIYSISHKFSASFSKVFMDFLQLFLGLWGFTLQFLLSPNFYESPRFTFFSYSRSFSSKFNCFSLVFSLFPGFYETPKILTFCSFLPCFRPDFMLFLRDFATFTLVLQLFRFYQIFRETEVS